MNYKKLGKILGKIMIVEGVLMCAPLLIAFWYNELSLGKARNPSAIRVYFYYIWHIIVFFYCFVGKIIFRIVIGYL